MIKKICKHCGKTFELSDSEIKFYKENNLELPKQCKECQKANESVVKSTKDKDHQNKTTFNKNRKPRPTKKWGMILTTFVLLAVMALSSKYGFLGEDNTKEADDSFVNTPGNTSAPKIEEDLEETQEDSQEDPQEDPDKILDEIDTNSEDISNKDVEVLKEYEFRKEKYLQEHFEKHGAEFDYKTPEEYQAGANRVIYTEGVLHKIEEEDGDDVYYLEETNEFVIVSTDGYLRTYFKPRDGIDYYNRQ